MTEPESANAAVARYATQTPEVDFLIEVDGRKLNFAHADQLGRLWAGALQNLGISAGDNVAIMSDPSADWVLAWLGVNWLRARAVGVNTNYVGNMLEYILHQSESKLLIVDADILNELDDAVVSPAPKLNKVIAIGAGPVPNRFAGVDVVRAEDLLEQARTPTNLAAPSASDLCGVTYTSGTTGRSKGVMMTWKHLRRFVLDGTPWDEAGEGVVFYQPFPMYHIAGLTAVYIAAVNGGSVVLRKHWSTEEYWQDIRRFGCTMSYYVGGTSEFIKKIPAREDDSEHTLRHILMTPLPPDLKAFEQRFGFRIWTFFASTEIGTVIHSGLSPDVPGTCGRARDGYRLRIVDDDGKDSPLGTAGELWVRAEDPGCMLQGYLNNSEAWEKAWTDGWFRTGDILKQDTDGNYYFVDRARDYIRRRGENISSREVEMAVNAHPAILESAAIGVPSETGEEEVMVFIELRAGENLISSVLVDYLAQRMPKFMRPKYIELVGELPRTPTGKVIKADLRKLASSMVLFSKS